MLKSLFFTTCFVYFITAPAFADEHALKWSDPIRP